MGSASTFISYKTTLHFQNFCHISPLCLPCHPTLARSGCLSGRGGRVGVTQDNSEIRPASATHPFLFHIFSSKKSLFPIFQPPLFQTNSPLPLISSHFPSPLQIILEGKWSNFATLGISLIYLTTFVPFQCTTGLLQNEKYSLAERGKWPRK